MTRPNAGQPTLFLLPSLGFSVQYTGYPHPNLNEKEFKKGRLVGGSHTIFAFTATAFSEIVDSSISQRQRNFASILKEIKFFSVEI